MNRFKKKLYYKYFDLLQISSFKGDIGEELYASKVLGWLKSCKSEEVYDIDNINIPASIPKFRILVELHEFKERGNISYIDNYLESIPKWLRNIVLPGYFDNKKLSGIINSNQIDSVQDMIAYFRSLKSIKEFGLEISNLYAHIVSSIQWRDFPYQYANHYTRSDRLLNTLDGRTLKGNFHNHTLYSDGTCSITDILSLAEAHCKEYVGISDHSKRLQGVDEESLQLQWNEIDAAQSKSHCRILKSVECEILPNGSLDLSLYLLSELDYVIIAIHSDICMVESEMERRLIRAIENPFSNILAHPSGRIYDKKPPILVNMKKIIDACVANNVAIEINGDPSRLDLGPDLIEHALNKGALFTLDSDTHRYEGYWNINNSIRLASDFHIPPEQCLNTFDYCDILKYFKL